MDSVAIDFLFSIPKGFFRRAIKAMKLKRICYRCDNKLLFPNYWFENYKPNNTAELVDLWLNLGYDFYCCDCKDIVQQIFKS